MLLIPFLMSAQEPDSAEVYKDRTDSLKASVFTSRQAGNFLMKGREMTTEAITAAGLCKMACCNLAESFENSASVTVGYSDAVTGARQIRLLGLSGTYTQMLDENRPIMRGLSAPFGLAFVPGQWLESIQIAKGAASVINGVESVTGQINLEHRKPTDEKPLFINVAYMSDTKLDVNVSSSLQINPSWSTVILGHVSANDRSMDSNKDGFIDEPKTSTMILGNRWLYQADNGMQLRFGFRALQDKRRGGQESPYNEGLPAYGYERYVSQSDSLWGSDILNRSINAYAKLGIPLVEDNSQNIAFVADYTYQYMDSWFGSTTFKARQQSGFFNALYQNEFNHDNKLTVGASAICDSYKDFLDRYLLYSKTTLMNDDNSFLYNAGIFAEYTRHIGEKFTAVAGLREDYYGGTGFRFSPRLTLKYTPVEQIAIRANAGRGMRRSMGLVDNIGVFSTSKKFTGDFADHVLEDAWVYGGSVTYYIPRLGASDDAYVGINFFHTGFKEQKIVDYEHFENTIHFYNLSALSSGRSFTNTFQADFSFDPVKRLTLTATFRYSDAWQTLADRGLAEKPMTSRCKGVLNCQYSTNLSKWIFDFTASVNGSCRVYDFMKVLEDADGNLLYKNGRTPVYPLLYLQVTRRLKGVDLYLGGENLTNYRQNYSIIGTRDKKGNILTSRPDFDASCVWGPLMGIKVYAGIRFTLWKTE